jgi:hypothetical protein
MVILVIRNRIMLRVRSEQIAIVTIVKTKTVTHNLESMKKVFSFVFIFVCCVTATAQFSRRGSVSSSESSGEGSSASFAGLLLDATVFYGSAKAISQPVSPMFDPSQSNEFDTTSTLSNLKLGWISSGGWYLGALYSDRSDANDNVTTRGRGVGLGLGVFADSGLNLRAFYKFNEIYGDYTGGEGFSAEATYLIKLSNKFYFGFLISHQQIWYSSNSTIVNFRTWTSKWTHPGLALAYSMR